MGISARCIPMAALALSLIAGASLSQTSRQKNPAPGAPAARNAPGGRAYMSQASVDSTVDRAFFELAEGSSMGGGIRQQLEGIKRAKALVNHLLEVAGGDPNEKYIRWRVGELQAQIHLEDQEIREQRAKERQVVVNHLVSIFNAEVGKARPDFSQLASILQQLESVDPLKANEMEASIVDRGRNIGREALVKIEKALAASDLDAARRDLDYCDVNLNYLRIPLATYGQLSAKMRVKTNKQQERAAVAEQLKRAERLLGSDSLGGAWNAANEARSRSASIRQDLPPQEYTRNAARWDRVFTEVDKRENELVSKNLELLQTQGIDAALAFLNTEMARYHISRTKIAAVNNAVISALLAQRRLSEQIAATSSEVTALVNHAADPELSVESLAAAAKKRAQFKADSTREAQSRKLSRRERRQRKRARAAESERAASPSRAATLARLTRPVVDEPAVETRVEEPPRPTQDPGLALQAKDQLITIYLLLEQNRAADARREFLSKEPFLKANLIPEAYEALRGAVGQVAGSLR